MPVGAVDAPTAGVALVRLIPDEVVPDKGRQLGFWGGQTQADERAWRALAWVGEMVGREAVTVAVWRGGRGPHDELALVPADTVDLEARVGGRSSTRRHRGRDASLRRRHRMCSVNPSRSTCAMNGGVPYRSVAAW